MKKTIAFVTILLGLGLYLTTSDTLHTNQEINNENEKIVNNQYHSQQVEDIFLSTPDNVGLENDVPSDSEADTKIQQDPIIDEITELEEKFKKMKNPSNEDKALFQEKISKRYQKMGMELIYHQPTDKM